MTEIRITGNEEEVKRIIESIRPVIPEILEINQHDRSETTTSYYLTVMEPLQKDSVGQVQDWAIIEYCQEWRTTPEIKKYFKMDYEATREICDRLYSQGILARRLIDKSYGYLDRGLLHKCRECMHFEPLDMNKYDHYQKMDLEELNIIGKCMIDSPAIINSYNQVVSISKWRTEESTQCRDYEPIQTTLDVKE